MSILKPVDVVILAGTSGSYLERNLMAQRTRGAAKIAHTIRNLGYSVKVIERSQLLSSDQLIKICAPLISASTIIGIGTSMMIGPANHKDTGSLEQKKSMLNFQTIFLEKLKKVVDHFRSKYNNRVLIGGADADSFKEYFSADITINGYAENLIGPILNTWLNNGLSKKITIDWTIQNCNFKWHETDEILPGETLPLETARGCIFNCKFCGWEMIGKKKGTYERDLNLIREEIIDNYNKYKTIHYVLMDDTFNDNDARVNQWCDMVESLPFKIYYSCYLRLDLCHRYQKTTRRLYETGLIGAAFGIETIHPIASKAIGKAFNGQKATEFLPYLWNTIFEKKVLIHATMIVGLPGESLEECKKLSKFFAQNKYINVYYAGLCLNNQKDKHKPRLDSEFSKNADQYGYVFTDASDPTAWKNDFMNNTEAAQLASLLVKFFNANNNFVDSWSYPDWHKAGIFVDEIIGIKSKTEKFQHQAKIYDSFNQSYVEKLLPGSQCVLTFDKVYNKSL